MRTEKKRPRRHPPAGSVPGGYRFLLLFGADDIRAFSDPTPRQLHAALPDGDRKMLALRSGEAVNLMIEQARDTRPRGRPARPRAGALSLHPARQLHP